MATGGGSTSYIGLDATQYYAAIERLVSEQQSWYNSTQKLISINTNFDRSLNTLNATLTTIDRQGNRVSTSFRDMGNALSGPKWVQTGSQVKQFGASLEGLLSNINALRLLIISQLYRAFGMMSNAMRESVSAAKELQTTVGLMQGITQDVNVTQEEWIATLRKLSEATGRDINEIAVAAYDALSNQITRTTEDTERFVKVASDLARATGGTPEEAVNVLSTTMNAFGMSMKDAEQLGAKFFAMVDIGRVKLKDISNILGRVSNTSKALGQDIGGMTAALSVLTEEGLSSEDSITRLNNLMIKLYMPTKEMQELFKEMGVTSAEQVVKMRGVSGLLQEIDAAIRRGSTSARALFPEIRTLGGYFGLAGTNAEKFTEAIRITNDAFNNFKGAIKITEETPTAIMAKEWQKIKNIFTVDIAQGMIQSFNELNETIGGVADRMKDLWHWTWSLIKVFGIIPLGAAALKMVQLSALGAMTVTEKLTDLFKIWKTIPAGLQLGSIFAVAATVGYHAVDEFYRYLERRQKDYEEASRKTAQEGYAKGPRGEPQIKEQVKGMTELATEYNQKLSSTAYKVHTRMAQSFTQMIEKNKKSTSALATHVKVAFEDIISFIGRLRSGIESDILHGKEFLRGIKSNEMVGQLEDISEHYKDQMQIQEAADAARMNGGKNYQNQLELLTQQYNTMVPVLNEMRASASKLFDAGNIKEAGAEMDHIKEAIINQRKEVRRLYTEQAVAYYGAQQSGQATLTQYANLNQLRQQDAILTQTLGGLKIETEQKVQQAIRANETVLKDILQVEGSIRDGYKEVMDLDLDELVKKARPMGGETPEQAVNRELKTYREKIYQMQQDIGKARPLIEKKELTGEFNAMMENLTRRLGDFQKAQAKGVHLKLDEEAHKRNTEAFSRGMEGSKKVTDELGKSLDDLGTKIDSVVGKMGAYAAKLPYPKDIGEFGKAPTKEVKQLRGEIQHVVPEIISGQIDEQTIKEANALLDRFKEIKAKGGNIWGGKEMQETLEAIVELGKQWSDLTKSQKEQLIEMRRNTLQGMAAPQRLQQQLPKEFTMSPADWEKYKQQRPNWAEEMMKAYQSQVKPIMDQMNKQLAEMPTKPGAEAAAASVAAQEAEKVKTANEAAASVAASMKNAEGSAASIEGSMKNAADSAAAAATAAGARGAPAAFGTTAAGRHLGGLIKYFEKGGPSGTDTVPAWLTPGEFVMPQDKAEKYKSILEMMRAGKYQEGGFIDIGAGEVGGDLIANMLRNAFYSSEQLIPTQQQLVPTTVPQQQQSFNRLWNIQETKPTIKGETESEEDRKKKIVEYFERLYHGMTGGLPLSKAMKWMMNQDIQQYLAGAGIYSAHGGFIPQVQSFSQARGFQHGGTVNSGGNTTNNSYAFNVSVQGKTPEHIARNIGRELQREVRRGNLKLS